MIFYRNMGNTPIRAVTIVDSLLPRLEYLKGTSRGPEGTAFSTDINRVGSTELRSGAPRRPRAAASGRSFDVPPDEARVPSSPPAERAGAGDR